MDHCDIYEEHPCAPFLELHVSNWLPSPITQENFYVRHTYIKSHPRHAKMEIVKA